MARDITVRVTECEVCQRFKSEHVKYPGLLEPISVPHKSWEVATMDFIEALPKSNGKDTILVMIDKYIKYCHLMALQHPFTATQVAQLFLDTLVKLYGPPIMLITDRDKIFISNFWTAFFKALGTDHKLSTSYHPQTDGQSERLNQCIEMFLRCFAHQKPTQWTKWLSLAEWWYNTTYHSAIKMTPYQALYGKTPPSIHYQQAEKTGNATVDEFLKNRAHIKARLKDNLVKAQERMKFYADKKRTERIFEVGDEVFLKLQPFKQTSMRPQNNQKFMARLYGPYKILKKIGQVAYQLELLDDAKIHHTFHVSQLKKKLGSNCFPQQRPPKSPESGEPPNLSRS